VASSWLFLDSTHTSAIECDLHGVGQQEGVDATREGSLSGRGEEVVVAAT
jgi:hypothetical protein